MMKFDKQYICCATRKEADNVDKTFDQVEIWKKWYSRKHCKNNTIEYRQVLAQSTFEMQCIYEDKIRRNCLA